MKYKMMFVGVCAFAATMAPAQTAPTAPAATTPTAAPMADAMAKPAAAPMADAMAKPAAAPMDINSATAKQLATLDGIGDARSAAIIKGRPYSGKDDLVNKKVLTQEVYDKIKDKIIAKQKK